MAAPQHPSPFEGRMVALRPFEPSDVPRLAEIVNHREMTGLRNLPHGFTDAAPLAAGQVEALLKEWGEAKEAYHLAIVARGDQQVVGYADCDWSWDPHQPGIHVVIDPPHRRKGLGSAAVRLLLGYLFDHTAAHNVSCWTPDWNGAGLAFARMNGFREAGRMRRAGWRNRAYFEYMILDLLRPEWLAAEGARHAD